MYLIYITFLQIIRRTQNNFSFRDMLAPSSMNVVFILHTMAATSVHTSEPSLIKKKLTNKTGDFYRSPNHTYGEIT